MQTDKSGLLRCQQNFYTHAKHRPLLMFRYRAGWINHAFPSRYVAPLFHLDYAGRSSTLPHFRSTSTHEEQMANAKTATLSFRIEPGLKEALRAAAEQEHRSIANMVEVMIRDCPQMEEFEVAAGVQNKALSSSKTQLLRDGKLLGTMS